MGDYDAAVRYRRGDFRPANRVDGIGTRPRLRA
jgi:hypothetical protein